MENSDAAQRSYRNSTRKTMNFLWRLLPIQFDPPGKKTVRKSRLRRRMRSNWRRHLGLGRHLELVNRLVSHFTGVMSTSRSHWWTSRQRDRNSIALGVKHMRVCLRLFLRQHFVQKIEVTDSCLGQRAHEKSFPTPVPLNPCLEEEPPHKLGLHNRQGISPGLAIEWIKLGQQVVVKDPPPHP